eukprot:COSAG02_NODE_14463_length_1268_cov_3.470488_1_plen_160_part_00
MIGKINSEGRHAIGDPESRDFLRQTSVFTPHSAVRSQLRRLSLNKWQLLQWRATPGWCLYEDYRAVWLGDDRSPRFGASGHSACAYEPSRCLGSIPPFRRHSRRLGAILAVQAPVAPKGRVVAPKGRAVAPVCGGCCLRFSNNRHKPIRRYFVRVMTSL